jgi:hydrogenase-4 component B
VLIAGMVSGILGVVYALGQHDLKAAAGLSQRRKYRHYSDRHRYRHDRRGRRKSVMAVLGFGGGLLHVLNHAIFKSLLFMGAGMVLHKTGTRSIDALGADEKDESDRGTTFLVGSLAISGLPPFQRFCQRIFSSTWAVSTAWRWPAPTLP